MQLKVPWAAYKNLAQHVLFIFREDASHSKRYLRERVAGASAQRNVYFRTLYGIRVGKQYFFLIHEFLSLPRRIAHFLWDLQRLAARREQAQSREKLHVGVILQ